MSSSLRTFVLILLLAAPSAAFADTPGQEGPHAPIRIVGDAAFTRGNGVLGGSGTASSPYVLSGWAVEAAGGPAVEIRGTRAHVVLKYMLLSGPLVLDDAENVTVDTTTVRSPGDGVRVARSSATIRELDVRAGGDALQVHDSVVDVEGAFAKGGASGLVVRGGSVRLERAVLEGGVAAARVTDARLGLSGGSLREAGHGLVATNATVTLSDCATSALRDAAIDARGGSAVRANWCDLSAGAAAARVGPDGSRVDLRDSFLGGPAAARVVGPAVVEPTLDASPSHAAGTWTAHPDGVGRGDVPSKLVREWTRPLAVAADAPLLFAEATVVTVDIEGTVVGTHARGGSNGLVHATGDPGARIAAEAGRVYVGSRSTLAALERGGGVLWERRSPGEVVDVALAGAAANGTGRRGEAAVVFLFSDRLLALAAADGRVLRETPLDPGASSLVTVGDRAVVTYAASSVHVVGLVDGRTVLRAPTAAPDPLPAVVTGGLLLVASGRHVEAFDLEPPAEPRIPETPGARWRIDVGSAATRPTVGPEGRGFVATAAGVVRSFDARTGDLGTSDDVGEAPTAARFVDGRLLLAQGGDVVVLRPGAGVEQRVPAGAVSAPAYNGEVAVLTRADPSGPVEGVAVLGADVLGPSFAPRAWVDGASLAWSGGRAEVAARTEGGWRPLPPSEPPASGPPGASAVRLRAVDEAGNLGPASAVLPVHAGDRSPAPDTPFARVEWRATRELRATADGRAEGRVTFWNNGTGPAVVEMVGTVARPPLSEASDVGGPVELPAGSSVALPFALAVAADARSGRYAAEVRFAVDGAPNTAFFDVVWRPEPEAEYRLRFVGGVEALPNGTLSALLAAGNDGDLAGRVTVEIRHAAVDAGGVATWTVDLPPRSSVLREVWVLADRDVEVTATIIDASPPDADAEDNTATLSLAATPVEGPAEAPDEPEAGPTGPLEVSVGSARTWVEERGDDVAVVRVLATEAGTLRLEVEDAAGLVAEVLDGPQAVGRGGEAVFRVRIAAGEAAGLWGERAVRVAVVDDHGRRATTDLRVLVHARAALPGTSTAQTAVLGAGVVVGAAAAVAVVGRENARWGLFGALLPLYTRIRRQEVLAHETRARIHGLVEREAGVTLGELQAALGLAPGVLMHHLHTLEREGYLVSRREGRHRRFFLPGATPAAAPLLTVAEADLLALVRRKPGLSQSDLARALGTSRQLVNYHVKGLQRRGVVFLLDDGRASRVFPVDGPAAREGETP